MKEEFDRKPGLNPAVVEVRRPLDRRPAAAAPAPDLHRSTDDYAWHMDGAGAAPVASTPDLAEIYQLDMWLNPHGFLKAARLPGANPKATWRWELGEMGRDGPEVRPEKVTRRVDHRQRQVPRGRHHQQGEPASAHPHVGGRSGARRHELRARVHQRQLRRFGNGIKFPTAWHSHQGWDDNYGAQTASAGHNAFGGSLKDIKANQCPGTRRRARAGAPRDFPVQRRDAQAGRRRVPAGRRHAQQRGRRVQDFVAVFEAPLNEERSLAVIERSSS